MSLLSSYPTYLATTVSNTLAQYRRHHQGLYLYRYLPLEEIVKLILSESINRNSVPGMGFDTLVHYTDIKLQQHASKFDNDELFCFYESLAMDLDDEISRRNPFYHECGNYVFYKWIDPVSLMLTTEPMTLEIEPFMEDHDWYGYTR